MKPLQEIVRSVGQARLMALITLVSVVLSVLVTYATSLVVGHGLPPESWVLAIATPLLVAPLAAWYPIRLLVTIHRMEEKMRALATYDPMTGAMTRQAFIEHAEQHLVWARQSGKGFSLLMIDIDRFKEVNDTFGHAVGDLVLSSFGALVRATKRDGDFFGRLGGEEFALLLPNTHLSGAQTFAEKLLNAIRNQPVNVDGWRVAYTASIGLEEFLPDAPLAFDGLLHHADRALYAAKKAGRDQAVPYALAPTEEEFP